MYTVSGSREDSWIISYCLESLTVCLTIVAIENTNECVTITFFFTDTFLQNDKLSVTIKSECWLLLGSLAKHHFITNISRENLDEILTILQKDLEDSNVVMQKNAAKAFELIAIPMGSLGELFLL